MLFIFIAGQSGSCKSWLANFLCTQLNARNINTSLISMDDYYKPKEQLGGGVIDYDKLGIQALDLKLFNTHLNQLNNNEMAAIPVYSFIQENWLPETRAIDPAQIEVVIIEGLFALRKDPELGGITNRLNIFIEADSYLAYMERRKIRDIAERGKTMDEINRKEFKAYGVRDTFFSSILPTRQQADLTLAYNNHTSREAVLDEVLPEIMLHLQAIHNKIPAKEIDMGEMSPTF